MASVDDEVLVGVDNHVCIVTINRPERRNARTPEVNYRMMQAVLEADDDPSIFLIAVTGAGDKAFRQALPRSALPAGAHDSRSDLGREEAGAGVSRQATAGLDGTVTAASQ
jgi:enoyl-CoA hydratase/carnithine racemase